MGERLTDSRQWVGRTVAGVGEGWGLQVVVFAGGAYAVVAAGESGGDPVLDHDADFDPVADLGRHQAVRCGLLTGEEYDRLAGERAARAADRDRAEYARLKAKFGGG